MSLRSFVVSVSGATPIIIPRGSANVPVKAAIKPAADILIGGEDEQDYPVGTSGVSLDLVSGDVVYAKAVAGTVAVTVLLAGV